METNGLLREVTEIWCLVIHDSASNSLLTFYDGPEYPMFPKAGGVDEAVRWLARHPGAICGHNIAGYDVPVIKKLRPQIVSRWPELLPCMGGDHMMLDTYMLSSLLYPQQQEHGIEYWGKVFKQPKPVHEDWSQLSKEMLHRCQQDVLINVKLKAKLKERRDELKGRSDLEWSFSDALELEQYVQQIHALQEVHGVRYDILKAINLMEDLDGKMDNLRKYIVSQAPWHAVNTHKAKCQAEVYQGAVLTNAMESGETSVVKRPFKKNGDFAKVVLDHFGSENESIDANIRGPFSRVRFDPMNIDSDEQVKKFLLSLGWRPTEWNISKKTRKRTSPKLTEDSYASLPQGVGRTIADYRICAHRRGMILNRKGKEKGGLWAVKHRGDGRVSPEAFTCGTPTSRYRHKGVVCNIPRPSSPYGKEVRETFCVPEGHTQLGLDLKGIEIRVMGHFAYPYPGGREFVEMVLDGDFHANNGQIWNVSRDDSKPGLYGLCYGCTPPKLATILGKPLAEGAHLYETFWRTYPALAALRADLEMMYKRNRCLKGLDGRRLDIREDRKLLNTLVQGASAVVFKDWMVRNYRTILASTMASQVHQIIAYHDELQYELYTKDQHVVESFAKCFKDNAMQTGRAFNLNVPIEADAKIGANWRECH